MGSVGRTLTSAFVFRVFDVMFTVCADTGVRFINLGVNVLLIGMFMIGLIDNVKSIT